MSILFIVLELIFLIGLISYIIYIFAMKRDFSALRIIIFILLFVAFIINTLNFFLGLVAL